MGWSQPFVSSPEHRTRADLTRELDVALHGEATISFPVTEGKWATLIAEVAALAAQSSVSPAADAPLPRPPRSEQGAAAPVRPGAAAELERKEAR